MMPNRSSTPHAAESSCSPLNMTSESLGKTSRSSSEKTTTRTVVCPPETEDKHEDLTKFMHVDSPHSNSHNEARKRKLVSSEKHNNKVTVYVRVVFLKLGAIDTMAETFTADIFMQARWREPTLDGQYLNTENELTNEFKPWDPLLFIDNNITEGNESVWLSVSYDALGQATVYQRRRVKRTFFERMELMDYPFDTQNLTLTISTERGEHELVLEADPSDISTVNVQSFVEEQEWFLHKHVNCWKNVTTNAYENLKYKHPTLCVSCVASRRAWFFVWNVITVMFFLCSLIFSTFSVDRDKIQNRLQLSFILLLATITFRHAVQQTLPKVSYLTFLDKYMLSCQLMMCVVCVWHAIISQIDPNAPDGKSDRATLADKVALGVLGGIYIISNIVFFFSGFRMLRRQAHLHQIKDSEHQDRMNNMEGRGLRPLSLLNSIVPLS